MKLQELIFIVFVPVFVFAVITFERTYKSGSPHNTGYAVQQTSDYGYAVLARCGTGADGIYFIRTDSLGDTLWTNWYSPTCGVGYSFKIHNGFIITGGSQNLNLLRINSSGDSLWLKSFGGDSLDKGFGIAITEDSNFIIVGQTKSYGAGSSDVWLIKTDTSGNVIWTQTHGGINYDIGRCVKNTADRGFIIVGSTYSFGAGFRDIYLVKTDSLGDLLWFKTYGGGDYDWGYDVDVTMDSGYIIVGSTNSFGAWGQDVYLIKTDINGDTLWTKTYGGIDDDVGYSVAVTPDGGFIVAGDTESEGAGFSDVYLIKTDSLGDIMWSKTYGGSHNDGAYCVENTQDNGFIITGYTYSYPPDRKVYLIKTDSSGNV